MLRKIFLYPLIFLIWFVSISAQELDTQLKICDDIIAKIKALPDINLKETKLELTFTQPVDHKNPAAGTFEQRVYILHKDFDKPVVLWLEGYAARGNREQELTKILDANQILVEHRYFGTSVPDSMDWQYLTIRQAAADHHRIVEALKKVYKGKWVSSGISKGGQTTIYHRRFYPDDVDASVCYVAPLNFSREEPRVYTFLASVGDADCRDRILQFQIQLLQNEELLMPLFSSYNTVKGHTFQIGEKEAFEFGVLEYSFSFWQWHYYDCSDIPGKDAGLNEMFDHFVAVSNPNYFSDAGISTYAPFFYQALTEIGYYDYDTTPFDSLLTALHDPDYKFSAPAGTDPVFNPESMQDIKQWLDEEGNNMIYIYGELDPWRASMVELSGNTNALRMICEGGDHRTRINSFPPEEKEQILQHLEDWLELKINRE